MDDLDYADDVFLISHLFSDMQAKENLFAERGALAGFHVNIKKTNSMRIYSANTDRFQLMGQPLEDVESFCYLGSLMSMSEGNKKDNKNRQCKAKQVYGTLYKFWRSRSIFTTSKVRVFNTNVKSVLL